ncbi:MAG: sensor histidine kinase [Bacteroidota bacterium]
MNLITTFVYSKNPAIRISRHVTFWVTDIINYFIVFSLSNEITAAVVNSVMLNMLFLILVTYFVLYYLVPKLTHGPNLNKLIMWITIVLAVIGIGYRYYKFYFVYPITDPSQLVGFEVWEFKRIVRDIWSSSVVISMALAIKLLKNKVELQEKNTQLTVEKKTTELNFLKAQMHPHFLFNTLNTLYSETIQESGKAQEVVLHLSSLLRFILDECNETYIAIGREIRVIKDFIALEQLRHGKRLQVNLEVVNVDTTMLMSPLIFLPFVENSFKHTLANKRGSIHIDIKITMNANHIVLLIENDKEENPKLVNGHYKPGKGITNVTRQLDLIYGRDYSLEIDNLENKYRVSLRIPARQPEVYA